MTITSIATGRATTAPDVDVYWRRGISADGIIFCHGSGETATTTLTRPETETLCRTMARTATVLAADFAGQSWGNDTAIARVHEAVTYMRAQLGVVGPVALVGGSMGFATAAAYTLAHPSEVKTLAGIIPCTDLADVRLRGAASSVDAAYGGAYDDATHGPTHSPVRFAADLPTDLPVHLWTCDNDPIVPPATADAFIAARPQTGRSNLGPLGHTLAAIAAATAPAAAWVRRNT